ncbi:MAG: zinc-dependent metalloprotease [Oceanihabitans sp.]
MFSYSQQIEKCATDKIMALERQKNPILFDQNREQLELFTREFAENRNQTHSKMVTKIPTVIHVIHNGEAVGNYPNISDVQLNSAITNLNNAFQNTSIYAGSTFYNSPMDIEFVLAKVKEDGTATTGIERHDVSGKPYATEYNNNGIKGDNVGVESEILFKDYFWNPQDYMNIWIVKKIDGIDTGTGASGTLGYATLPTTFPGITDGLVCQARAFGYNPAYDSNNPGATPGFDFGSGAAPSSANGTADHEVGHYLNLHHTFNGDNNGTTCPPVSGTIGTDDDGCADIPPHKRTNSVCPADNPTGNSCTGGSNEHIHNFMDYSSDDCFSGFSNDQRTRVHAAVNGPRVGFTTAIGHITPTINTFPVAVTNTPVVTDQSGSNLGIFDVTLNGTSFKSISAYNDGFYINRVASQPTITLVENTAYTITVKVGVGNTVDKELVDVYIDYNNDGSFNTTNERIHQTPGGGGKLNGDIFTINFTTPTAGNFVNSQKLRMRVISDFDNNVDPINNSYTSNIGNIEDYSVVFNPTMSINDNTIDSSKIKIYPNPTNAILNIKNLSNAEIVNISIIDALGRKVNTHLNTHRIPVNKLQNGLYFIQVEFRNSNTITKRFIKQ